MTEPTVSGAADRAALWAVFMAILTAAAMILESIWGAGWQWETSTLLAGVAFTVLPMVAASLWKSYGVSRSSVDWLDLPPFAPQVMRSGAVDEVVEPTQPPTSPGSAGVPHDPPTVNFTKIAPPPAYFDPMAPNPNVAPPLFASGSARSEPVEGEQIVGKPETTVRWPKRPPQP
jgi:hypothetical protein